MLIWPLVILQHFTSSQPFNMASHARSAATLKRRRDNQKDRRQLKSDLGEDVMEDLRGQLEAIADGQPKYSEIARDLISRYDLVCSVDWLREKVRSKWQEWTGAIPPPITFSKFLYVSGFGARRQAQRTEDAKEAQNTQSNQVDKEIIALATVQTKMEQIQEGEKQWAAEIEKLWSTQPQPPPVPFQPTSEKPGEIQDDFCRTMLEYWAANPHALKFSDPVEPASQGPSSQKHHILSFFCF